MKQLSVRSWTKFQHYKDRRPPWIKFYINLLEDDELSAMPKEARLLYPLCLLLAAVKDNRFPANPVWLAEELNLSLADVKKGLAPLLASGHLQNGSSRSAP